jgi:hypothetical protein
MTFSSSSSSVKIIRLQRRLSFVVLQLFCFSPLFLFINQMTEFSNELSSFSWLRAFALLTSTCRFSSRDDKESTEYSFVDTHSSSRLLKIYDIASFFLLLLFRSLSLSLPFDITHHSHVIN